MDVLPFWSLKCHLIIITQMEIFKKFHIFLQQLLEHEFYFYSVTFLGHPLKLYISVIVYLTTLLCKMISSIY